MCEVLLLCSYTQTVYYSKKKIKVQNIEGKLGIYADGFTARKCEERKNCKKLKKKKKKPERKGRYRDFRLSRRADMHKMVKFQLLIACGGDLGADCEERKFPPFHCKTLFTGQENCCDRIVQRVRRNANDF